MTCKVCGDEYDRRDDLTHNWKGDPEWSEKDGRCYNCHRRMLCGIYGQTLKPVFTITAPSVDIPF